jgi:hypothetical protein
MGNMFMDIASQNNALAYSVLSKREFLTKLNIPMVCTHFIHCTLFPKLKNIPKRKRFKKVTEIIQCVMMGVEKNPQRRVITSASTSGRTTEIMSEANYFKEPLLTGATF